MEIPEFKIGDLVVNKAQRRAYLLEREEKKVWMDKPHFFVLQVVEIVQQECYAAKQTHYVCHPASGVHIDTKPISYFPYELELAPNPKEPQ